MSAQNLGLSFLAALGLVSASASAAIIDFDAAPAGPITDFYRAEGVVFKTVAFNPALPAITPVLDHALIGWGPSLSQSGGQYLSAAAGPGSPPPAFGVVKSQYAVLMEFVLPGSNVPGFTNSISIELDPRSIALGNDPSNDRVTLYALDVNGAIIASDSETDQLAPRTLLVTSGVNDYKIARAVLYFEPAAGSIDDEKYDNLKFGKVVIPEPTTLAAVGAVAVTALRRRRR
jgi:hypothetical protein